MLVSASAEPQTDAVLKETEFAAARQLASIGRAFYRQQWVLGTSGNFSAVVSRDPFRLLITASGMHKGMLAPGSFLQVDDQGEPVRGRERPSAETLIHLAILSQSSAGAILHTHSVWATILSDAFFARGGLTIHGYEMLKGLSGVKTHEHQEWLPILENSQDYACLSGDVSRALRDRPHVHGILLRRHGLYTWGSDIKEARRHTEIFEFLFEVIGRQHMSKPSSTTI